VWKYDIDQTNLCEFVLEIGNNLRIKWELRIVAKACEWLKRKDEKSNDLNYEIFFIT